MERILIVDDEKLLVKGLRRSLEQEGYTVLAAYSGQSGLDLLRQEKVDLVLLDLMLPELGGLDVCREIRRESQVPVIMLTARGDDVDKIVGLELGADDYLTKPFNTRELLARIRAVLRRSGCAGEQPAKLISAGKLSIDGEKRKIILNGQKVDLTAKEFDLLYLLARSPGRVYTRENLLDLVWGVQYCGDGRTVDVHVRRVRDKIENNPREPEFILTSWGVGYYFKEHARE